MRLEPRPGGVEPSAGSFDWFPHYEVDQSELRARPRLGQAEAELRRGHLFQSWGPIAISVAIGPTLNGVLARGLEARGLSPAVHSRNWSDRHADGDRTQFLEWCKLASGGLELSLGGLEPRPGGVEPSAGSFGLGSSFMKRELRLIP